jgi:hypothetical protein
VLEDRRQVVDKADIYIGEADSQIEFAKRCFTAYREAEDCNDIPGIFFHIHHFVIHVANVDKLLSPKPSSFRAAVLRDRIDLTGINLKPLRKLRNHLEHFDERLDAWVKNYDGYPFFDNNIVTGTKGFPKKAFLRALDGDIFKFHGESYDLVELYHQVVKIQERLSYESAS